MSIYTTKIENGDNAYMIDVINNHLYINGHLADIESVIVINNNRILDDYTGEILFSENEYISDFLIYQMKKFTL